MKAEYSKHGTVSALRYIVSLIQWHYAYINLMLFIVLMLKEENMQLKFKISGNLWRWQIQI